jgi:hypothetical protein
VVLEHEPDPLVAERRLVPLVQPVRIDVVERHRAGRRRLERAEDVEQRALAAARRPHDGDGVAALQLERRAAQDRELPRGVGYDLVMEWA